MRKSKSKEISQRYNKYLFATKELIPNVIKRGKGSYVWDLDENKILDLNAGQFCSIFGHAYSEMKQIISEQIDKIVHTSTRVITPEVLVAAEKVSGICSRMNGKVIFLSTGSEAVECALRFAKHIKSKKGIICLETGYHGLTLGSQSVTYGGRWAVPEVDSVKSIPVPIFHEMDKKSSMNSVKTILHDLEEFLKTHKDNFAALIMEPIVSVGGMTILSKEYCEGIYRLCKKYEILLIYDECQTGLGRTGKWFNFQHYNIIPDILIAAKGLGDGFPVSMVVFNADTIDEGQIGILQYSSHQNDPLSGVIVTKVIEVIREKKLFDRINSSGKYLLSKLEYLDATYDFIKYPRGTGLMIGFDIYKLGIQDYRKLGNQFSKDMLDNGVMMQSTCQGRVYRLLPNYFVSKSEIDFFVTVLESVVQKYEKL